MACAPCEPCIPGTTLEEECHVGANTKCIDCEFNTFSVDGVQCLPCHNCVPAQFPIFACLIDQDRQCGKDFESFFVSTC